jgi:DNA-directed RNA polymerase specialized sigma24 family protein
LVADIRSCNQKEDILGQRKINQVEKAVDNERVFLDHYAWLRQKAQVLFRGAIGDADDLVHDLYVNFVQSGARPDLEDPDRLRGYLNRALENFFVSKTRRNGCDALSGLIVSDFDTIEYALTAVDRSQLLVVRSDLATICEYACIRRWSHRGASVLILRFFLGYFPSEIAEMLQSKRSAVDQLTKTGRLEARAYLTRPGSLVFMGDKPQAPPLFPPYLPDNPADLNAELRRRLFSETEGACFSPTEISDRYSAPSRSPFSTLELAHLVSCSSCLDRVNEALNLPSLSMRFFSDSNEPRDGDPSSPGPSAPGSPTRDADTSGHKQADLHRRLREVFEHRPETLQVAVNGTVVGSTLVASSFNEIKLKLELLHPEFIEVLSEQGRRLLYLDLTKSIDVVTGPESAEVRLSDNRCLRAEMTWGAGVPVVHVTYQDPLMDDEPDTSSYELPPSLSPAEMFSLRSTENQKQQTPRRWKKLIAPLVFADSMQILRYGGATAIVMLLAGLFVQLTRPRDSAAPPTASALLQESLQEEASSVPFHGAIHRTFGFEVRSDKGDLLESGTVETFKSFAPKRSAMRLRNANGKVLAGRWVDSAGKVTAYPSTKEGNRPTHGLDRPSLFDRAWEHVPDADDFEQLTGEAKLTVQRNQSSYDLGYSSEATSLAPAVLSAHLLLASDTKRPIGESLRIRENNVTRDYRFQQLTYEVVNPGPALESDFAPESELVSLHPRIPGETGTGVSSPHLTLQVLQLLSNLGPDVERIVDVERMPDGSVGINGVFPTAEEKQAVQRVFEPLRTSHQLRVALHSGDETPVPDSPPTKVIVEALDPVSVKDDRIPLDADLRSALSANGVPEEELEPRIHDIATNALRHCSGAHREAWTIHQIAANDFSRSELQSMQPEDRMLWLTLLDKHIRMYSVELTAVSSDLTPLFPSDKAPPTASLPAPAVRTIAELDAAADTLNRDSERLDRVLTSALTLSTSFLPANHNAQSIEQLLAALRTQESQLHSTIERLQTFGQLDRIE